MTAEDTVEKPESREGHIVFGQQMSLGSKVNERELVEERKDMEQPRAERR